MLADARIGVVRETDDVREMADDAVFSAQLHDIVIHGWMILRFVCGKQRFSAEGFDSNEHLKASRPLHQANEFFLLGDLRIALRKKWYEDVFRNHLLQEFFRFGVLVEIVGREHYQADTSSFGLAKTFNRRRNRLAPN